jgi:hypothetical protein
MSALRNRVPGFTNLPEDAKPPVRSRSTTMSTLRNRVAGYSTLPDENSPPAVRTPSPTPINFDLGPKFTASNVSAEMIKATESESSSEGKSNRTHVGPLVFERKVKDDVEKGIGRRQAEQDQIFAEWRESARKNMTTKQKDLVDQMMKESKDPRKK